MLEIKNLHVAVDGKEILKGLSLSIKAGEVHAIMGPNGSGKSTLSYVLAGRAGYESPKGSIAYNGEDLAALRAGRARRQGRVPGDAISGGNSRRHHHDVPQDARSTPSAAPAAKANWMRSACSSACAKRPRRSTSPKRC